MTPELIKQWARQAGMTGGTQFIAGVSELSEFAALVAAHQREMDAKVCDEHQEGGIGGWKHNTPADCAAAIRGTK